jgi:predicted transcriptional regulator
MAQNLRGRGESGVAVMRYRIDTTWRMAMTLRLTDDEQAALRERAKVEGISMQEAARRAVRDYVARGQHRERVSVAARRVMDAHAEALRRLGE